MINLFSLNFKDDLISRDYLNSKQNSIQHSLGILILILTVRDINQLAFRTNQSGLTSDLLNGGLILFKIIAFFIFRNRQKHVDKFILFLQIVYYTVIIYNYEEEKDSYDMSSSYYRGYYSCFSNFIFYNSTFEFTTSILLFALAITRTIYVLYENTSTLIIVLQINIVLILLKYWKEKQKRKNFLQKQYQKQWDHVIQDVISLWIIQVGFNPITNQIEIRHANLNFKQEFGIEDVDGLKVFLRNLQVYDQKNKLVNLENKIQRLIQSSSTQSMEVQTFEATNVQNELYQEKKNQKYTIKLQKILANESEVLLIVEKKQDFAQKIQQRQQIHQFMIEDVWQCNLKNIKQLSFIIKSINAALQFPSKLKTQLLSTLYIMFNGLLNQKLVYDLDQDIAQSLKIQQFNLSEYVTYLSSQFRISIINLSKVSVLQSDFSQLTQLIITTIEFSKSLFKAEQSMMRDKIKQQPEVIIRDHKKNDNLLVIQIFNSSLQIHPLIVQLFQQIHFTSQINKVKFKNQRTSFRKELKKIIKEIIQCQNGQLIEDNIFQFKNEVFQSYVTIAYLITTLGPSCQIRQELQQEGSLIEICIYKDLKQLFSIMKD